MSIFNCHDPTVITGYTKKHVFLSGPRNGKVVICCYISELPCFISSSIFERLFMGKCYCILWYVKQDRSSIQLFFVENHFSNDAPTWHHFVCSLKNEDVGYCWKLSGVRGSESLANQIFVNWKQNSTQISIVTSPRGYIQASRLSNFDYCKDTEPLYHSFM